MIAPRPLRPARAAVLVIAVIAVIAAPAAPGAPRAHAEGRSGTALVEYAPRSLAVPLSAAGPGRLELVDASGSVALSVRGGTVLAEAPEGGELSLRAVPDEGAYLASLRVGGRDVRDYTLEHLRDGVSMVLQNGALFSGTIAQNLRWGNANATQEQLREACAIACADEFIDRFPDGYETVLEQNAANLSGGQKQRLRIARAIVKQPKILILDDSTSAVDMATDEHIRRALKTAMPGSTKIIIAQRIASILSCDRIIVLHEGELSDVGTHAELMERSQIYRDVYDSQMREEGEQHGQS